MEFIVTKQRDHNGYYVDHDGFHRVICPHNDQYAVVNPFGELHTTVMVESFPVALAKAITQIIDVVNQIRGV